MPHPMNEADVDGDNFTDGYEYYISNTDPSDASSYPGIDAQHIITMGRPRFLSPT